jgi:hypothetical protein
MGKGLRDYRSSGLCLILNIEWNWGREWGLALEVALTRALALVKIDYSEGKVILVADASLNGWGGVLIQLDDK